jgi:hypothetical protein
MAEQQVATWWQPSKTDWTIYTFVFPQTQAYMIAVKDAPKPGDVRKLFDAHGYVEGREPYTGSPLEIWERPNWIARPVDPIGEGVTRQDPDK